MFRKNVAGQHFHVQGIDSATGGIKSGVTWTVRRCIDGTFAAATGTVTEDGTTGWYKFALSQADTNGNNIGFSFTGTGAIPQTVNIITTAADPTDTVRLGLTALPNAAAEAAGGLYTRGTGAGQVNQPANGQIDANAVKLGGTTQTGRDIGASVLLSSGTGTGQLDFTGGVVKANLAQILGTALTETAGQIAAAFKKFFDKATPTGTINSIPDAVAGAASGLALVGSNVGTATSVTGAVGSVTADVGITQAGADKVWASTTRTLSSFGSLVADIATAVWGATTRLLTAGTNIVLAKGVGVTGFNDLSAADVKAEVDTGFADYDGPTHAEMTAELGTADDATLAAIAALNNPTVEQIADSVWERVAVIPFLSTTVLDDFNRVDESPVTGWTKVFTSDSDIELVGNQITGAISSRAVFAGLTPADDQEVYLDVSAGQTTGGGLGNRLYLLLRVTGETSDAATGYFVMVLSSAVRLYRFDSFASIEELAAFSLASMIMEGDPVLMAGDQIGARVRGNVFEVWVNIQGAGWTRIITATDSTYPSGKIGLGVGTLDSNLSVDNFGGGDFVLPVSGADVIADAVWDENIVAAHTDADSAGNKLNQALILYEGN